MKRKEKTRESIFKSKKYFIDEIMEVRRSLIKKEIDRNYINNYECTQ